MSNDIDLNLEYNGNILPADITQRLINLAENTLNVPPSYLITKLHYEGLWGGSPVAHNNNNWGGMTWVNSWSDPYKRVSGVTVTKGSARPSAEGGYYIKYETVDDFLTDWSYLIRRGGIYNVANSSTFNEAVKGMFVYGGAQYDYAIMGVEGSRNRYNLYLANMLSRREAINNANEDKLNIIDDNDYSTDPPVDVGNLPNKTIKKDLDNIFDDLLDKFNNFEVDFIEGLINLFTPFIYNYGNSNTKSNSLLKIEKIFEGVYKINMTLNITNLFDDLQKNVNDEIQKDKEEKNRIEKPDDDSNPSKINGDYPFYPTTKGLGISSVYGWRIHPISKKRQFHSGTDFRGQGQVRPLYAVQDSKVINNYWTDWGGWMIVFEHTHSKDNYFSRYQHLNVQSPLSIGTNVSKGDKIGDMGTTGDSTGIHLHLEIATSQNGFGTEEGTIDPEKYLKMRF